MKKYQIFIIDIRDRKLDKVKLDSFLDKKILNLNDDGIIWIICNNLIDNEELYPQVFLISEFFLSKKFLLKNIIIWPDFGTKDFSVFKKSINYILFFTKSNNYFFNKDPIREKHIWKDVEWGKRKKNYNPLGKDPGNVWLMTQDDGHANITKHIPLDLKEVIGRLIKSSTKENHKVLFIGNPKFIKNLDNFGRIFNVHDF